jgi:hypothetical protein
LGLLKNIEDKAAGAQRVRAFMETPHTIEFAPGSNRERAPAPQVKDQETHLAELAMQELLEQMELALAAILTLLSAGGRGVIVDGESTHSAIMRTYAHHALLYDEEEFVRDGGVVSFWAEDALGRRIWVKLGGEPLTMHYEIVDSGSAWVLDG